MSEIYNFNDKDSIKAKLPSLSEALKFTQIEIIGIDRDILNQKDLLKYEEAKLMMEITKNTDLKNQSQRDAELTIQSQDKLKDLRTELYNLQNKKKLKEAEMEYKSTELRINFYYYKDLLGIQEKRDD